MFRKIWVLLTPFHRAFALLIVLSIFYEAGQILGNYTISLIIRLFELKIQLWVWIVLALANLDYRELFMRLDNTFDWHVISRQSHPIYRFLKLSAIAKFFRLDLTWQQRHNSGTLVGQVSDGVWKTLDIVDLMSWEFMPTIIQTLQSLVPLFILTPGVGLITLTAFGLFIWLTLVGEKAKRSFRQKRHDLYEEEWSQAVQMVQGYETVIMFGQQQYLMAKLTELHDRIIDQASKEQRLGVFKYNRWRIRVLVVAMATIMAIWVHQLYQGTLDVPNLIFVSVLVERLFNSFWRFARLADRVTGSSEAVSRLLNLIAEKEPEDDGSESVVPTEPVGISFKGVCFDYLGDYEKNGGALHDFDLEVAPGSIVALVGPSGAGKTTIRKVVTKLVKVQHGTIEVAGLPINRWSKEKLLRLFSYVPQGDDVYIWDNTVRYNIAFPRPEATDDEVIEAAKLAGIHDFIASLAEGYQTLVGERGVRLSGGQKQRVALARAILADRPVLILDEATSAVDAITEREIQTNMRQILTGRTAIIIAHRLSTIWDIADKIVVMDQGRKVEEGSHRELVVKGGLYAQMVALQT